MEKLIDGFVPNTNELEARFTSFFVKGQGITAQDYYTLLKGFEKGHREVNITTEYPLSGDLRRRKITTAGQKTAQQYERKKELKQFFDKRYGYKLSLSQDQIVTPGKDDVPSLMILETTKFKKVSLTRIKNRHQQIILNGNFRIDASEVVEIKSGSRVTRYELELEVLTKVTLAQFMEAVEDVLKRLYSTRLVFTRSQFDDVRNWVSQKLSPQSRDFNLRLQDARTLTYEDLVSGGVTWGYEGPPEGKLLGRHPGAKMTVSLKADGVRKLLVVYRRRIWLLYQTELSLIYESENLERFEESIFEGELLPNAPPFLFLAYDTLWYRQMDTRSKFYSDRVGYGVAFARSIGVSAIFERDLDLRPPFEPSSLPEPIDDRDDLMKVLLFSVKESYYFENATQFFTHVNYLLDSAEVKNYHHDGLILTPLHEEYQLPRSQKRVLTKTPDICKWKPPELMTIDVRLILSQGRITGFQTSNGKILDISEQEIDQESFGQTILNTKFVYEVAPSDGKWKFERFRRDKPFTNSYEVIRNILFNLRPGRLIKESTIRGFDLALFRKYQNRVKRKLFDEVQGSTLLDIGSGFGGDLSKWKKFHQIVAVEPDPEHVDEFLRRHNPDLQGALIVIDDLDSEIEIPKGVRILLLQTGGEDPRISSWVQQFIGGKVDVVSSMFSLSFFWKDSETLIGLQDTIQANLDPKGSFIFATIDGMNVREIFDPLFGIGFNLAHEARFGETYLQYNDESKTLTLWTKNPWTLNPKDVPEKDPGDSTALVENVKLQFSEKDYLIKNEEGVIVSFDGTIVQEQTEYLVDLDDIARVIPINYVETTSGEQFLPVGQYTLSTMYSAGMASFDDMTDPLLTLSANPYRKIYSQDHNLLELNSLQSDGLLTEVPISWWPEDNLMFLTSQTGTLKELFLRASNQKIKLSFPEEDFIQIFDESLGLIQLLQTDSETLCDSEMSSSMYLISILQEVGAKDWNSLLVLKESDSSLQVSFNQNHPLVLACTLVNMYQDLLQSGLTRRYLVYTFLIEEILFDFKPNLDSYPVIKNELDSLKSYAQESSKEPCQSLYRSYKTTYLEALIEKMCGC